ncbi:hypothetical protein [Coleofasciculus sp. G2-EDA-02]
MDLLVILSGFELSTGRPDQIEWTMLWITRISHKERDRTPRNLYLD